MENIMYLMQKSNCCYSHCEAQ